MKIRSFFPIFYQVLDVVIFFSPFCSFTSYRKIDILYFFRRREIFIFFLAFTFAINFRSTQEIMYIQYIQYLL